MTARSHDEQRRHFLGGVAAGLLGMGHLAAREREPADLTADGAWCWFADPRALCRQGRLYAGWVTSDGTIQAGVRDLKAGATRVFTVHARFNRDDHANPALLLLPDGRLLVFYSAHSGPEMYLRVCRRPADLSDWEPTRPLDLYGGQKRPRKTVTYPNPYRLSGEKGRIYLLWRGDSFKPHLSWSNDDGATWARQRELIARPGAGGGNRPYVKAASDGQERIHLLFTDGHPRNEPTNRVFYLCYRGGAFYRADGRRVATLDQLPIDPAKADLVYDASAGRAWVWDVAFDRDHRPIAVYTRHPRETDHRYHHVHWDGKRWVDRPLTAAGQWFPATPAGKQESEPHYSGGLVLDHADPWTVYLSRPVTGRYEIERWTTRDAGATWTQRAVTERSKHDNVRPFVVRDREPGCPTVLWMENRGGYIHYLNYRCALRMGE